MSDVKFENPYEILGVAYKASSEDLRAAYLQVSRENHPDKGGDADKMARIIAAWNWLEKDRPGVEKRLRVFSKWPAKFCVRCSGTGKSRSLVNPLELVVCPKCSGRGV